MNIKKPISVGKGFRKISLQKLIDETHVPSDTVVLFDAIPDHKYTLSGNGIAFTNTSLTFKGDGPPENVVIATPLSISNSKVTLKNLTIDVTSHRNNAIFIKNSTVTLENIIAKGHKDFPTIYIDEYSTVTIHNTTSITQNDNIFSLVIRKRSQASIHNSLLNSINIIDNATVQLHNNLINGSIEIRDNSKLEATNIHINNENHYMDIQLSKQSEVFLNSLNIINGLYKAEVNESYLSINNINTNHSKQFLIFKDDYSDVVGDGFEVINHNETIQEGLEFYSPNNEYPTEVETINSTNNHEYTPKSNEVSQLKALDELNSLIGLNSVKEVTRKFIAIANTNKIKQEKGLLTKKPAMHSMFIGNPGTGKTTVARLIARALYEEGVISENNFVEVSRQDLVSEYIGKTASQTLEILESARNGVLFIDEAYTLTYGDQDKGLGQEAIDTILKYMEDHREEIMIIFAGYTNEMMSFKNSNPGLASRIPYTFDFEDYTIDQLVEIGNADLISQNYKFNTETYSEILRKAYRNGFDNSNARWVRNFNEQLTSQQMQRVYQNNNLSNDTLLTITDEDLAIFDPKNDTSDKSLQNLLDELNALIGLTRVKERVNAIVNEVKINQLLEEQGHHVSKSNYHMVFTGSPGTGKTTVARLLSEIFKSLGLLTKGHLIETNRSELIGSYIGHTEKNTKEKIEQSMGGVLFIDEAYQLTPKDASSNDFGVLAVETLITHLENKRGQFIAIFAGYENDMEHFLNANEGLKSRIPYTIHFDDYLPSEVADIVVMKLQSESWKFNEHLLREIVENKYRNEEKSKQSNGRWARNFVQDLLVRHKNNIIEQDLKNLDITVILDSTIKELEIN
ncbi:AAA family ATPase [Staphylococcus rostri]|uniref:AAA family ATPase n=1 Tax=Staphylococcus rostri TaxID=522262 RepID=UPI002852C317|nr:AAA family ATPase [Staphylococcus rostri]